MPKVPKPPAFDRRTRFAEEYAKDRNATQAAIRSGYSKKTAKSQGSRLLTFVDVQSRIAVLLANASVIGGISVERTAQEIARIGYGDIRQLFTDQGHLKPVAELSDDAAAMISSIEVDEIRDPDGMVIGYNRKVKLNSKVKALDQCMAYLGMHKTLKAGGGEGLNLTIQTSGGTKLR